MQVKVRVGMTLSTLAQRYNTSVQAIAQANGITNANMIRTGQVLQIPGKDDPIAPAVHDRIEINHRRAPGTPAVGEAPTPAPAPAAPGNRANLSDADVNALVRAVAAEARGESPQVWEGVAQTIINYAQASGMGIPRLTRTSYLSSNFDGNRRYYTMPMARIPNESGIRDAVLRAADFESPIGNRTHFHDTSIRTPSWGDRSSRVQIGHIVFYNTKA